MPGGMAAKPRRGAALAPALAQPLKGCSKVASADTPASLSTERRWASTSWIEALPERLLSSMVEKSLAIALCSCEWFGKCLWMVANVQDPHVTWMKACAS